jgi:hypothetical protein
MKEVFYATFFCKKSHFLQNLKRFDFKVSYGPFPHYFQSVPICRFYEQL